MSTSSLRKNSAISAILIAVSLNWVVPKAQAVTPAPDGGYPGNNTAEGTQALQSRTTGVNNTALGYQALFRDSSGGFNSAEGFRALFNNRTGFYNTATGANALFTNSAGSRNTATGLNALYHNTASDNTATGTNALYNNTTGAHNTAHGYQALFTNKTGSYSTAIGYQALVTSTGDSNVAVGADALRSNTSGEANNAIGNSALISNTVGRGNNAVGAGALFNNTGNNNTAIGDGAGTGLTTGAGNVCIGHAITGTAGESDITRIRNIGNTAQDTGLYVTLDSIGGTKLGVFNAVSSRRYKDEIKPMEKTSEALFSLKPVNFRYKPEINRDGAERFGLIAEEVEKINPDLVSHDSEGRPMAVRYESINAMLLNEFLKEHRKVQELEATVAQLAARLKEQESRIQKVSAQVEVNKPAQTVAAQD